MNNWRRVVLIVMSVGGGFTGAIALLTPLFHASAHPFSKYLIFVCFLAMYVFVTISGVIFAMNREIKWPLITALLIQVPYISSTVVAYRFGVGCHLFSYVGPPETVGKSGLFLGWDVLLGSGWTFGFVDDRPWRLGVNLIALGLLMLLKTQVSEGTAVDAIKTLDAASTARPPEVLK